MFHTRFKFQRTFPYTDIEVSSIPTRNPGVVFRASGTATADFRPYRLENNTDQTMLSNLGYMVRPFPTEEQLTGFIAHLAAVVLLPS